MPSAWQKRQCVEQLHRGGLIAYPTEAVYGLGCDPSNRQAVFALLALKKRAWQKGLILIAADFRQVEPFINPLPESIKKRIHDPCQQATTWVLPAKQSVPDWLTGTNKTIAVRLVQHPLAQAICRQAGMAIVSTSANHTGCEALRIGYKARLKFGKKGVFILNGSVGGADKPSRLIDPFSNEQLR